MSTTELEVMRAKLARAILNEENEKLLAKIIAFVRKEKKATLPFPCQMTVEELKMEVAEALEDVRTGRTTSHDDLKKEMQSW
jgi:O6-methylguanine-DNA--protein-cysteine methyltransferase